MKKTIRKIHKILFSLKKKIYRNILSTNVPVSCGKIKQPVLFLGEGKINIAGTATLGYFPSPYFYSTYMHIEVRSRDAAIEIGENTFINNNAAIIAERAKIKIGDRCLIGANFSCVSSDFHGINPRERENYASADVSIGSDCFIGNNVTVLKGVEIGGGGNHRRKFCRHKILPRKRHHRRQSRETHSNF